jgi:hypothetical protein
MVDIEVYPVMGKPGDKPDKSAKPLAIRGPWFDRLDATEAVKQWVSGKANGGFFVKTCPGWDVQSTCLEIAYEGKPADLPAQASGVKAVHRAGQTFITWGEIKDTAEPVGKDPIKWADLRQVVQDLDKDKQVRYCVYRSDKPIDAKSIAQAELIATVKPLSCWNINGRNIDRPIDDFIATNDVLNWHQWNPFRDANTEADYGRDCIVDRLVIEKDPLPTGSGLHVHTATKAAKAYYAVLASIDGVQNCVQIDQANATGAIEEKVAEPEPVFQRELPRMPMFNFDQRRLHFVHFAAPPYVNVPGQYYNWSVGVPNKPAEQRPLELSLPRDGYSYWRTQYRIENDSIVLSPHDFPLNTWWYGYHEAFGTLKSFKTGKIQPYTERRLLWMVSWALRQKEWAINPNRILVTGCRDGASASGALHIGLRHPEVFALAISGHGQPEYASIATDSKQAAAGQSMQALWGRLDWRLPTDSDKIVWDELDMTRLVQSTPPTAELPLVTMTSDHGRAQVREFYKAMLNAGRPVIAEFSWGGTRYVPVSASGTYPTVIRMDIRKDRPAIGCVYAEALDLLTGKMGEFNTRFRWRSDDAVDTPERFEITVSAWFAGGAGDLTLRRMQKFKVQPGKTYAWTNTPLEPQDPAKQPKAKEPPPTWPQQGSVTVDKDGLLVVKGVRMLQAGSRLVVHQAEGKQ